MRPIGRQCASGLSLLFSALRAFTRSAAHGCSGRPSLKFAPTSRNVVTGGPMENEGAGARSVPPPAGPSCPSPRSHIPDRSGLPSVVRGAGAVKSDLPSGVLGTPAVGYGGHCAHTEGAMAATIATTPTAWNNAFISEPPEPFEPFEPLEPLEPFQSKSVSTRCACTSASHRDQAKIVKWASCYAT